MNKSCIVLAANFLVFSLASFSQQDSLNTSLRKKPSVKLGIFGVSKLNYYGRTDSLKSSGFFPILEVWVNKNFYISAAPVFVYNNALSPYYGGTVTTAGVLVRNKKWSSNNYISLPVYRQNSGLVQQRLKLQATAGISRITKVITINGSADIRYSGKLDYTAAAGLDHVFRIQAKDLVIAIDPTTTVNAGTQQFNATSYKQSGLPLLPPVQQKVEERVRRFSLLSYEFSAPLVVAKGRFQFIIVPAYVIPQNIITVEGRPDLSERGENMFYFTAGVKGKLF